MAAEDTGPTSPGQVAERTARSDTMKRFGRVGLAARGAIYLLVGLVALLLAFGYPSGEPDQQGALQELARRWYGIVVLWLLFLGLVAFALWSFTQAAVGISGRAQDEKKRAWPRVQQFVSGCIYGSLAVSTFTIAIRADRTSQAHQQQAWTARAMSHAAGRWAVAVLGLIVLGTGIGMAYTAVTKKFEDDLDTTAMDEATQHTVQTLGIVGGMARGVVFGLSGFLLVDAAWTFDAAKGRGLDGALRTLERTTFGPWLLGLAAVGLIVFGLFSFTEARYRHT